MQHPKDKMKMHWEFFLPLNLLVSACNILVCLELYFAQRCGLFDVCVHRKTAIGI